MGHALTAAPAFRKLGEVSPPSQDFFRSLRVHIFFNIVEAVPFLFFVDLKKSGGSLARVGTRLEDSLREAVRLGSSTGLLVLHRTRLSNLIKVGGRDQVPIAPSVSVRVTVGSLWLIIHREFFIV